MRLSGSIHESNSSKLLPKKISKLEIDVLSLFSSSEHHLNTKQKFHNNIFETVERFTVDEK